MDLLNFNIDNGCTEAIVHGWKSGMLRSEDYANFSQCETLEDMKMHLQATDYGNFLANEERLSVRIITDRALDKLVADFFELRDSCVSPLSKFLDFVSFEYMIGNVLKLIGGAAHGKDALDLLYKCHPLGMFEGIAALTAATSVDELWAFLVDSPLGPFFEKGAGREDFNDQSIEFIRAVLYKNYLEAFYDFCVEEVGGTTGEVMAEILEFEADRAVITTVRNTFGSKILPSDKERLFPRIGRLVPLHGRIAREAEDDDSLRSRLAVYSDLADLLDDRGIGGAVGDQEASIERKFQERSIALHKASLGRQMHFGVFYSWLKLKEIEISNLMLIAECVTMDMKGRISEYIPIY
eukprot:TRINITY_DN32686_c0_g1_i1.p1 TRINITY_DN32686_c0_g1~~TRINITY_DN32686_c0_g1_i1.p1  ORF type:complete len:352 (-),score=97.89 TRINITY_DN32686_c0_g1_i1:391-1446(-)